MPTGGVDLNTAESFLAAGACCLGVGSSLVEPKAVAAGDFGRIESLAAQYVEIVRKFRAGKEDIKSVKSRSSHDFTDDLFDIVF
jgi:2-dehydro-3-deoxyphosphogluconate aldolase/(4S)-4-hydroxy-2-oxoglutarate aldolase